MKPFKFFQKETPSSLDHIHPGETYSTASFPDTPEGHMARRRYYHTNMNPHSNNEMEQYFFDRRTQPQVIDEVTRRINGGGNNNYIPFFTGTPRATRTNPKWWMKIKIFFQEAWLLNLIPVVIVLGFTFTIAIISKILNVW